MTSEERREDPAHVIRRARQAEEKALVDRLEALKERLLDVPELRDLRAEYFTLRHTPLECGCHCSGWCNGYNPCAEACATHRCH